MNILIISHEYYPIGGGAGKAAYHISKEYHDLGQNVFILTCKYKKNKTCKVNGITYYNVKGYRKNSHQNHIFLTFLSFMILGTIKAKKVIKINNIDIVHCFFTIPAGVIGLILNKYFNTPYFVSLRGSDVPFHTNSSIMKLAKPIIKYIWKRSSKVIALSNGLLHTAKKTYDNEKKYIVVYNGVKEQKIINFKENIHGLKIVSAGRLHYSKGYDVLIKAISYFAQSINFRLIILGDGPERSNLVKLCKNLSVCNRVEFLGFKREKELIRIFKDSHFFVLPSRSEAFGQVFTEALSCGLPVIGTNIGGIPEIINDEVGILVEPNNPKKLFNAIKQMIDNIYIYNPIKIKEYAKKFSWRKVAKEYLEIFKKT